MRREPTPAPSPPAPSASPRPRARRRILVPVAILAVAALLVAAVLWLDTDPDAGTRPTAEPPSAGATPIDPAELPHPSEVARPDLSAAESREAGDPLAEGPVDAPVVLVVFTDYQCPYCARWTEETLPALREYVAAGELRIEWRDVNVYGEDSTRAARAALAAGRQGRHAEYQEALYDHGEIRPARELTEEAMIARAEELGLDVEQFAADLRSEEVARIVDEHAREGVELGVVTTPSFVLAGTPFVGAQPTATFVEMVETALADAPANDPAGPATSDDGDAIDPSDTGEGDG